MPTRSAGILLYRRGEGGLEVLLVHPGGPFFRRKDAGVWGIPKGEHAPGEDALACARREFAEETGSPVADGPLIALGEIRQRNGKIVSAWAVEGDLDADGIVSNTFVLEWPPRSGRQQEYPEVDRAGWFDRPAAAEKMIAAQQPLIDRLAAALGPAPSSGGGDGAGPLIAKDPAGGPGPSRDDRLERGHQPDAHPQ
jgi:predicted NUDIX family NTP pyrophosphohydrolase